MTVFSVIELPICGRFSVIELPICGCFYVIEVAICGPFCYDRIDLLDVGDVLVEFCLLRTQNLLLCKNWTWCCYPVKLNLVVDLNRKS